MLPGFWVLIPPADPTTPWWGRKNIDTAGKGRRGHTEVTDTRSLGGKGEDALFGEQGKIFVYPVR